MDDLVRKLRHMEAAAGSGTNDFTMSRGSFRYRQKLQKKVKLQIQDLEEAEDRLELHFADAKKQVRADVTCEACDHGWNVHVTCSDPSVNRFWITLPQDHESFYGGGETYSMLDLKGQKIRIFVAEHQNTRRISAKIIKRKLHLFSNEHTGKLTDYESYYAQPTFVSSALYFVHCDVKQYCEFDFRKEDSLTMYFQEKPSFRICQGESYEQLSCLLGGVIGHQHALPDWIDDGIILAMQGGTDVLRQKLAKAEAHGIKVNGIWSQDWCGCRKTGFGYQVMWNWRYDEQLYHDLPAFIEELHAKHIHFLGYINPFLALEKDIYQTAKEKGYCVKNAKGEDYLVKITTFPAAMIDFTNPEAYAWYKNLIKQNMIGIGLDGWMADFGEYLPLDAVLYSGEDPAVLHNQWPAIWARMNREAILETGKEGQVFFFTRAGNTETVKYSDMMWTGDQHVDWSKDDGLPSVIPASLSLGMSGFGITHSDAGGYTTIMDMRRSKELLLRWLEMNIFSPLLRTHEGNQPVNDFQFDGDEESLRYTAFAADLHSALKPYLQEVRKECIEKGIPMMRPLFYHYAGFENETEEYLLGRDVLVAPVLKEGAVKRMVRLPEDTWIQADTGKAYTGGTYEIDAPLYHPPVFIRQSSEWAEPLTIIIQEKEQCYETKE